MVRKNDKRSSISNKIHLRQLTIDEALPKLDKYLNDVFIAGIPKIVVIHGKGTGALSNSIHKQLDIHPLVASYRQGIYGEGGTGVTIVEISHR
ncbi:MAG: Smr/MutS family protein [Dehalococcoidia bacterium]|nr:MAG: Smr/MutS family protein [Dehalococcoidia bacterium]